jgi:hypothetical protein
MDRHQSCNVSSPSLKPHEFSVLHDLRVLLQPEPLTVGQGTQPLRRRHLRLAQYQSRLDGPDTWQPRQGCLDPRPAHDAIVGNQGEQLPKGHESAANLMSQETTMLGGIVRSLAQQVCRISIR